MNKCLMIQTKTGTKYLTHYQPIDVLLGFVETFDAEVYLVKPAKTEKILSLKKLSRAFCNPDYKTVPDCEIIERIHPRSRQQILVLAEQIRTWLTKRLLSGKAVSLKEMKAKFKNLELTSACLCNHFTITRKKLVKEGHNIEKTKAGTYQIAL